MTETKPQFSYTDNAWQGEKYELGKDLKDIAKETRQYLKKKFPKCKFSITIERYSMGQSLNIYLMGGPFTAIYQKGSHNGREFTSIEEQGHKFEQYSQLNQYTFSENYYSKRLPMAGWNNGSQLSFQAWYVLKDAVNFVSQYNFDDSDSMIDYFHTNFYLHVNIGKWNKPFTKEA